MACSTAGRASWSLTAARNGYFFVARSRDGRAPADEQVLGRANWAKPGSTRRASRCATRRRTITSPARSCRRPTGRRPTGRRRRSARRHGPLLRADGDTYAMYLPDRPDPRGALGLGGKDERTRGHGGQLPHGHRLQDRQDRRGGTGIRTPRRPGARRACSRRPAGCCSPATSPATSSPTIRRRASRCGTRSSASVTNAPQTYMVDGRQYVLVAAGDTLYAFALY